MGNCCQNENTRDMESDRLALSIPAPIPQDSKKNSLVDPNFVKMNQGKQFGQNHIINMNGLTQLQTNRNSFASTPQQSGSSPHGYLSNSKNNVTEYNSFISGLLPYREKDILARIQHSPQNLGELTGRSKFSKENNILRSQMKNFYIITSIYTPMMSNQKIDMYNSFVHKLESLGCRVVTIEFASISSPFLVTEDNFQPYNFQIRLEDPIFLRFNVINQVLKKLPESWEWVGIIDYNVQFENDKWIEDTQESLRSNRVVQLFERCREINHRDKSQVDRYGLVNFIENLSNNQQMDISQLQYDLEGGKAWAFRKDFYLDYYYLVDIFVTGFEETLLSLCLYGQCTQLFQNFLNEDSMRMFNKLQQLFKNEVNSQSYINGQISVVSINPEQQQYTLLNAIYLLNHQLSSLYIDNLGQIHIRNSDQKEAKEELKFLSKLIL